MTKCKKCNATIGFKIDDLISGNAMLKGMKSTAKQYARDKVISGYCDDCYFQTNDKKRKGAQKCQKKELR